jgi:hypothetical protein
VSQNFQNHSRFDPKFHFFIMPVLFANLIVTIVAAVRFFSMTHLWLVIVSAATLILALTVRMYSAKVQDRVIRLEERLRLQAILPEALRPKIPLLTERQLIALRFACDTEVTALVEKTLAGDLAPKDIKQSVGSWRADEFRV